MRSVTLDIGGPVHVMDHGGRGRPLILVHGLGGSHLNWGAVAGDLAKRFRVHAIDLVGFGLSPPAGREVTVEANQKLLGRYLAEHVREPAILAGNSMGGLISILEASTNPHHVDGLVLVNPAVPRNYLETIDHRVAALFGISALPYVAEAVFKRQGERTTPEQMVKNFMKLCCKDADSLQCEIVQAHVEFARNKHLRPWADDAFIQAARSLLRLLVLNRRAVDHALKSIRAPALLIGGAHDKLIPMTAVDRVAKLRPDWTVARLGHVGHVPQLEDPKGFVELVTGWADRMQVRTARSA